MDLISVATSVAHNERAANDYADTARTCREYNDRVTARVAERMRDTHAACAETWRDCGVDLFGSGEFTAAAEQVARDGVAATARRELARLS